MVGETFFIWHFLRSKWGKNPKNLYCSALGHSAVGEYSHVQASPVGADSISAHFFREHMECSPTRSPRMTSAKADAKRTPFGVLCVLFCDKNLCRFISNVQALRAFLVRAFLFPTVPVEAFLFLPCATFCRSQFLYK